MKVSQIQEILEAEFLTGMACGEKVIRGCGGSDLISDITQSTARECALLTGLTTLEVIQVCARIEAGCVVFVRGKRPPAEVVDSAEAHRLPLLMTRHPLFVACGRLYINGLKGLDGYW